MRRRIIHWGLIAILMVLVFVVGKILFERMGHSLDRHFYEVVLTIEGSLVVAVPTIIGLGKNKIKIPDEVRSFLSRDFFIMQVIIVPLTLVMLIFSGGESTADQNPAPAVIPAPAGEADGVPSNLPPDAGPGQTEADTSQGYYISLTTWEEDPFLLKLNDYFGYDVQDEETEDAIYSLLDGCRDQINVRGYYDSAELNGADSKYAGYTKYANDLRMTYSFMNEEDILSDKQIEFLEDEIQARMQADGLYHVSENQKIIGDNYVKLGNICADDGDIFGAFENYAEAFQWFRTSYQTALEEGQSSESVNFFIDQMVNAKDKMQNLTGIDRPEGTRASQITDALKRLEQA